MRPLQKFKFKLLARIPWGPSSPGRRGISFQHTVMAQVLFHLGRSTTMVYSYPFSLAGRGVVATIDLSTRNLHMLRTDHWLADPGNTVQVWLKGRAWDANEQTVNNIMVEGPPRAPLQEWSTSELAARCIGEDAEGLATRLVTNSVNGEDFAAMTYETFVNDLHFTPFAARKLDALRTKFMQA